MEAKENKMKKGNKENEKEEKKVKDDKGNACTNEVMFTVTPLQHRRKGLINEGARIVFKRMSI